VGDVLAGSAAGRVVARGGSGVGGCGNPGGGGGSAGKIRYEANQVNLPDQGDPIRTFALVGQTARVWPEANSPVIMTVRLDSQNIPADPLASMLYPGTDAAFDTPGSRTVSIDAMNVPSGATMVVRVITKGGPVTEYAATRTTGADALSTWQATITLAVGFSAIQARVVLP
jgi:hypothetical protein